MAGDTPIGMLEPIGPKRVCEGSGASAPYRDPDRRSRLGRCLRSNQRSTRGTSMRGSCMLAATLWSASILWSASTVSASAQASQTPGMGTTSPLGTTPSPSSSSSSGSIPLGATELIPPGLSPLQMPCPNTASNAAFDGGGSSTSSACSNASSSSQASTGSSSDSSISGMTTGSASGSGIPLGAIDLGTPGESQTPAVPSATVAPCPMTASSALGTSTSPSSNGSVSAGGC